ncbi:S8 family serine peptidase [Wenzhouxiangella sp. XN79A]|uniref:S8 family serine peptidase n=1 Tax=Wenzhouxiangella sp. XN79A TaxID=2724193 RepID=UPI00144ADC31|nr:S8 family serine peptidase [Wenzhouxiangella sp. XN79A]NKI33600.1 S8 family serine peptidase [Wenzhouxiangella sp. XN79A]
MKIRALTTLLVLATAAAHASEQPLFELHESVRSPDPRSDWRTGTVYFERGPARSAFLQAARGERSKPVSGFDAAQIAASAPTGKDGRVLVEIRFDASRRTSQRAALRAAGAEIHTDVTTNLVEAWVEPRQLKALQRSLNGATLRPARLVQPTGQRAGSVTSEGVVESGADIYHGYGADGSGQIITIIDSGFAGWSALQASGDWPAGADLQRFEVNGSTVIDCSSAACPTFEDDDHGANTVSIAFDTAPGATFRVYKTRTVGEWYEAMLHASDETLHADGRHSDIISASLSAPLDGVGDGSACPPNQPAPCGTIAEAAEIAQARRSFVVNAAANNRENHWGGLYSSTSPGILGYQDALSFGGGNLNVSPFCLPDGFPIRVEMFWDDWTDVDHDYDLFLVRRTDAGGWTIVSSSTAMQSGSPASQNPQEFIGFTASGSSAGCTSGSNYGVLVARWDAPTNRNIQLFSNIGFGLNVPERSLGFPADNAAVFAVGALDLSIDDTTPAWYSSEGPVLAPGGGLPSGSNPPAVAKPDGMSFSPVSTSVGGGTTFGGTSSAAPHAAGLAALLNQVRQAKPIITTVNCALAIREGMEWLGQFNGNDLNAPGHDTTTGHGRMRLSECSKTASVAAERWQMISTGCERLADPTVASYFSDTTLGAFDDDWSLWSWDAVNNSYQRLTLSDTLAPERSYWIFSDRAATVQFSGVKPDITEQIAVDTVGEPGSVLGKPHMIANPRLIDLDWSEVQFQYDGTTNDFATAVSDGKVRSIMWTWEPGTGQYQEFNGLLFEGSLPPGGAFWIRTLEDVEVRIPTPAALVAARAGGSRATDRRDAARNPSHWLVDVAFEGDDSRASVRLGQHEEAKTGFDHYDAERLPGFSAAPVAMAFAGSASGTATTPLQRDFRTFDEPSTWYIEVEVNQTGHYTLDWFGNQEILSKSRIQTPWGRIIDADIEPTEVDVYLVEGVHRMTWIYEP